MKRIVVVFLLLILLIVVSGCGNLSGLLFGMKSNADICDEQMESFLNALEAQDTKSMIALFAQNALIEAENMAETVDLLYSYYQGNYYSYDNWGATNSEKIMENGYLRIEYYGTYDVTTNMGTYRFVFHYVAEDSFDEGNVGLNSIYVIKMEDDTDMQYAYRGDGLYTPGIQIGVPNTLPEEFGNDEMTYGST